jgi:hypothetical protein
MEEEVRNERKTGISVSFLNFLFTFLFSLENAAHKIVE